MKITKGMEIVFHHWLEDVSDRLVTASVLSNRIHLNGEYYYYAVGIGGEYDYLINEKNIVFPEIIEV